MCAIFFEVLDFDFYQTFLVVLFFLKKFIYLTRVDIQYCVGFRCTTSDSFPLQVFIRYRIELHALYNRTLQILYIAECIKYLFSEQLLIYEKVKKIVQRVTLHFTPSFPYYQHCISVWHIYYYNQQNSIGTLLLAESHGLFQLFQSSPNVLSCFSIPSRIHTTVALSPQAPLDRDGSSDFLCFLMTLIVLRRPGLVFYTLSFNSGLSDVFFMVRLELWVFRRNTTEVNCLFHYLI